jgi:DNA-binding XRE family transcriptional regulator
MVREKTLEQLSKRNDDWLHETASFFSNGKLMNNYFKWFHVLEDEISHRG